MIPRNGFGYASHMRMHVREGTATMTWNDQYKCYDYRAVVQKVSAEA
jgi:hypothetical protein